MQLHKIILVLWVCLGINLVDIQAQSMNQVGVALGVSYYLGDLNETEQFKSGHTHFTYGLVHRLPINSRFTWKNNFLIGQLSGADKDSDSEIKRNRNLSFQTRLYEFSTQLEFNFLKYHSFVKNQNFSPYLYVGMGLFWIDPVGEVDGNYYKLREYRTEGQSSPYSKTQFAMPFGLGVKFKFSHRVMFSIEYGFRRTFTDYIDDVSTTYPENPDNMGTVAQALSNKSLDNGNGQNEWGMQRGNSQRKDLYSITSFTMLVRIGKNPNLCRYNTQ